MHLALRLERCRQAGLEAYFGGEWHRSGQAEAPSEGGAVEGCRENACVSVVDSRSVKVDIAQLLANPVSIAVCTIMTEPEPPREGHTASNGHNIATYEMS